MSLVLQKIISCTFIAVSISIIILWIYGSQLALDHQLFILLLLTILTGIPHGALDAHIAAHYNLYSTKFGLILFLTGYVAIALTSMAAWWIYPLSTLTIFLLISIWHFSGDWSPSIGIFKGLLISGMAVCLPALNFTEEVRQIFMLLTQSVIHLYQLQELVYISKGLLICCSFLIVQLFISKHYTQSIEVLCLMGIALTLPPILYFAIYFCILHSPKHLLKNISLLNLQKFKIIILSIWPATAAVIVIGLILVLINTTTPPSVLLTQLIFIGLFGLTIPHMLLIEYTRSLKTPST